jgi:hypothetical protein
VRWGFVSDSKRNPARVGRFLVRYAYRERLNYALSVMPEEAKGGNV